jgi:LytS/YehU family sensor histidine kinase
MSDTIRSSLKNQESLVTLREEMKCVRSFLLIQEYTLNGRVEFSCTVGDECLDALIPAFTVEMLAENACVHGFSEVKSGGKFELDVRQIGGSIHINVKDNGSGFNNELAAFLNSASIDTLTSEEDQESGLRSLLSALYYHFGKEARWKFSRLTAAGGTQVQIIIPARCADSARAENSYQRN